MEQWRKIAGYENYSVSNYGRVRNDNTNKVFEGKKQNTGYIDIVLCHNGVRKHFLVHRLVATAFVPNPNNYPIVNHKDENKTNNNIGNLEWCDKSYNAKYGNATAKRIMNNCKTVRVIIDGVEYNTMLDANRMLGVPYGALRNRKTEYKGHKIKYIANDN